MKYYKELAGLQCFTRADVEQLTGNKKAADSLLREYKKKGYIESVKRNLYVTMSMETQQPIPNRYQIASNVGSGSYFSHHSAFEYYGYANQVFYEVYVSGENRFAQFEYDGVTYRYIAPRIAAGVERKNGGIRVTDMERTVLDGINDFEKITGLEELLRCLDLIPSVNEKKLLFYLEAYNKRFLYQKAGYMLQHFQRSFCLSNDFFDACEKKLSKSVRYLYRGIENEPNVFNNRWQLVVPENLMQLISKGGSEYVAIG